MVTWAIDRSRPEVTAIVALTDPEGGYRHVCDLPAGTELTHHPGGNGLIASHADHPAKWVKLDGTVEELTPAEKDLDKAVREFLSDTKWDLTGDTIRWLKNWKPPKLFGMDMARPGSERTAMTVWKADGTGPPAPADDSFEDASRWMRYITHDAIYVEPIPAGISAAMTFDLRKLGIVPAGTMFCPDANGVTVVYPDGPTRRVNLDGTIQELPPAPVSDEYTPPAPVPVAREAPPDPRIECMAKAMFDRDTTHYAWEFWLRAARFAFGALELPAAREAEAGAAPRQCTCHPDDNPPKPCPQKFALSDCRDAAECRLFAKLIANAVPDSTMAAAEERGLSDDLTITSVPVTLGMVRQARKALGK